MIAEDNIYERKVNLNADRGMAAMAMRDAASTQAANFTKEDLAKLAKPLYGSSYGKQSLLYM